MAWWILQNVAIAAVLAAAVALICRVTRIGPVTRHALWLLVLVKLITPPLVVWPWAVPDVLGLTVDARADDQATFTHAAPPLERTSTTARVQFAPSDDVVTRGGDRGQNRGLADLAGTIGPWLLGLWLIGSVAALGIEAVRATRLARRVRAGVPVDPSIARRAAALASTLGIRPIRVVAVTGLTAPAVWSLGRPVLMWPRDLDLTTTDASLDGLLVHELAHIRRRDHLVGWLELAAGVVWWWNPLFWFVRSALREQAELACDAWVISALPNGRRAYAESLLALSGAVPRGASLAVIGIHATSRRVLERRLVMIMKGRAPIRLSLGALLAIALVAGATLPAWAIGEAQQTPPAAAPLTMPAPQTTPPATTAPPPATAPVPAIAPQTPPAPKAASTQPAPAKAAPSLQTPKTAPPAVRKVSPVWAIAPNLDALPADAKELAQGFEKDRAAIQAEVDKKVEARRTELVKALEALQEQYTKAGKLDEAVAIRDYIKAGGTAWWIRYSR
jgi:beta-lactamase regulating signal transducer with metallopeptidase domain